MTEFWARMETRGPGAVLVDGVEIRPGSRVRVRPRARADVLDLALAGRVAVVEGVEQDDEGRTHLALTLDDDPGRDLGEARLPGHRFFYLAEDVEPLDSGEARILVAGIGNVFLGDDGFGVEVVRRLAAQPRPAGVDVVDFGIRGMDLVYALHRGYHTALLVDAAPHGAPPGTVSLIEPDRLPGGASVETHGMDPVRVLGLARELGSVPSRILVLACEPGPVPSGEPAAEVTVGLTPAVDAAVAEAVHVITSLIGEFAGAPAPGPESKGGGSG